MRPCGCIVCALAFSTLNDAAAERVAWLARQTGTRLIFPHIVERFSQERSNVAIEPESADPAEFKKRKPRRAMDEAAGRFRCAQAKRKVLFALGSAWHEIGRFAKPSHADLIVPGSHGRHDMAATLGRSAHGVVNRPSCDVLAMRLPL